MNIASVETVVVRLPTRRRHVWASSQQAIGSAYVIVRVKAEDARYEGWGEAPVLPDWGGDFGQYGGEAAGTVTSLIEHYLGPACVGQDCFALEALHARWDRLVRGNPYAKAALDVALHDLQGKLLGLPVYQLIGGLVRDRVPLAHSLGIMDVAAAVDEAKAVVETEGVKAIKLKVGRDPAHDVALIRAVRRAIGDRIPIRIDANQGYRTPKEALWMLERVADCDVWFLEQPCEGIEQLAKVARMTRVPIMADESVWTVRDVFRLHELQAAEMVSLYYTKPGGLFRAKQVAAACQAAGLLCDVNGSLETGIGNAANVHLAASTPVVVIPGSITVPAPAEKQPTRLAGRFYLDDIIKEPYAFEDGCLVVPHGPGLGVELDEEKLARYRVA